MRLGMELPISEVRVYGETLNTCVQALNRCLIFYRSSQVWLGFVINNFLLPFCMLYTFFQPHIEWSGIHYYKEGGRIVRVERL